jgi:hypothetical protein
MLPKRCYAIRLLQNLCRRGRHSSASFGTFTTTATGLASSRETLLHVGEADDHSLTTYRSVRVGPPWPSLVPSTMTLASSSSSRTAAIRPAPPPPPLTLWPWIPMASHPLHLPETSTSVPSPLSCVGHSTLPPSSPDPPRAYC